MAVTLELIGTSGVRRIVGRKVTSAVWDVAEDGGYGTCELEIAGLDPPQVGDCLTIRSDSTPLYRGWCERVEVHNREGTVGFRATFAGLASRLKAVVLNRRYAAGSNQSDVGHAAQAFLRIVKSIDPTLPLSITGDYIDTTFGITVPSADWLFVAGDQALRTLREKCIEGVLVGFGAGATKDSNFMIFRRVVGQPVSWYLSTKRRWVQAYESPTELGDVVNALRLICGQSPAPNLVPNGALRQVTNASPGAANLLSDPGWEYYPINAYYSPWRGSGSPVRFRQGASGYPYMQPLSGEWLCEIDQLGDTVWQDVRVDGYQLPRTIMGGVYAAKRETVHGQDPVLKVTLYAVNSQGQATELASQTFTLTNHTYQWYGVTTSVPAGTYKVRLALSANLTVPWPDSSIIMDNAGLFWTDSVGQVGWSNWSWGRPYGEPPGVVYEWVADSDTPYSPEPVALKATVYSASSDTPVIWGTAADQLVGNIRRGRYRLIVYYKAPNGASMNVSLARRKDNGSIVTTNLTTVQGTGQLATYSHESVMFDHSDRAVGILFEVTSPGTYTIYGVYLGEATRYGTATQPLVWVPESRAEYSFRVDNQGPHTIQLDLNRLPTDVRNSISNYGVRAAVVEDDTIRTLDEAKSFALRYFTVKGAPTRSYQVTISPSGQAPLIRLWDDSFSPINLVRLDGSTYRIKRISYRLEAGQIEQTLDLAAYHPTLEQLFKQQPTPRRQDLALSAPPTAELATPSGPLPAVVMTQTRHNELLGLQGGDEGEYYHLTSAQHSGLTSGGNTSLHLHDDRYGRLAGDNTWTGINSYQARVEASGGDGSYTNPTIKLSPSNSTTGWSHLGLYAGWDQTHDYMVGRGTSTYLSGRALTLHIPSRSLYGHEGEYPKVAFTSSGGTTLGWIEADTGHTYIKGKLGVGADPSTFNQKLKVVGQAVATFRMYVESEGHTYPFIGVQQWTSTGTGGVVWMYRSGGTISAPEPLSNGSEVGVIKFGGMGAGLVTRPVGEIQAIASSVGSDGIVGSVKLGVGTSSGGIESSVVLEPGLAKVYSAELQHAGTMLRCAPPSGAPTIRLDSGSGGTYEWANLEFGHGGVRRWNLAKVNNSTVDLGLARYNAGGTYQGWCLYIKGDTGIVGIGNLSNPSGSQLHVYTTTAGRYAVRAESVTSITSSSTVYDIGALAYSKETISSGVSNSGYVMGASIQGWHDGAGVLATAYGARVDVGTASSSTGTLTTAYGVYIRVLRQGGSSNIATAYGLYIESLNASTKYAIVQAGANDKSVFYGPVGLGGRTPSLGYPLEINGGMYLTGSISLEGSVDGVDISGHAADPNAHHARVHSLTGSDHTIPSTIEWNAESVFHRPVGLGGRTPSLGYPLEINGSMYLTGSILLDGSVDGVDISGHAADSNAHHARVHSLTGSDHTVPSTIEWAADMRLRKYGYTSFGVSNLDVDSQVYMDASNQSAGVTLNYSTSTSLVLTAPNPSVGSPRIDFIRGGTSWTLGWSSNGLNVSGQLSASAFVTGAYAWVFSGYSAGTVTPTGYVTVTINGTTYRLVAATV